ncbi:MAG TPA: helix-hairpin-helix domain-containing protein, partial [Clostridia bacterium]|nr:helix-hairpin-helix domain-containing protein [Clostridia bacterium]
MNYSIIKLFFLLNCKKSALKFTIWLQSSQTSEVSFPIHLNSATKEDLTALPGIGDTLAQRIIDYRSQH